MKAYASQNSSAQSSSSSTQLTTTTNNNNSGLIKRQDLLSNDNSTLTYGEHKPDDAALDRVAGHLNSEAAMRNKRSRARPDDAEVNYINDKNKHFNKKIARFYDKYTKEIRENCECLLNCICRCNEADQTFVLLFSSVERGTA